MTADSQPSISQWIIGAKEGRSQAIDALWGRYFDRLVRLARRQLAAQPRRAADEEDLALSAFASFCRAAEEGRFPDLSDRDDLWRLLVTIAVAKIEGFTNKEIADRLDCSVSTVERSLRLIRRIWQHEMAK
jgi:DNA-directed RNA polymerase specialized sigma24 family protein